MSDKTHAAVVVIGHVDSGKSTTTGHLLYKCGTVDKKTVKMHEKESTALGKGSFKYAWILDGLRAERERGVTIETSSWKIESQKYVFTLIDAPGHRDFIKNMINGTSSADVALLVVDASRGGFEAGWASDGQTREHILLAFTLGVKQMVVAVNKMDSCSYFETRFNDIKGEVFIYIKKVGYKVNKIRFVPVSGWVGDNLTDLSSAMPWYKGPTLLDAIDKIDPPHRYTDKPLRIPVNEVYTISGVGTVFAGRVAHGVIKPGMTCNFGPTGLLSEVKSVQMHSQRLDKGVSGDHVGVHCTSSVKDISRGHVASDNADNPVKECESFTADMMVMSHPGQISNGYCPIISCHTTHIATEFRSIDAKMDRRTGKVVEVNPRFVKQGDAIHATLVPTKPMVLERFSEYPYLGRFAVRDLRHTVAVGVVKSVVSFNHDTKSKLQKQQQAEAEKKVEKEKEAKRLQEEAKRVAAAKRVENEARRLEESRRLEAEAKRLAKEAKRLEEAKRMDEDAKVVAAAKRVEDEAMMLAESRRLEETKRLAEAQRLAESQRLEAEAKRLDKESKRLEEVKKKLAEGQAVRDQSIKADAVKYAQEEELNSNSLYSWLSKEVLSDKPHLVLRTFNEFRDQECDNLNDCMQCSAFSREEYLCDKMNLIPVVASRILAALKRLKDQDKVDGGGRSGKIDNSDNRGGGGVHMPEARSIVPSEVVLGPKIGGGGFGAVYKAQFDHQCVAVKSFGLSAMTTSNIRDILNEVRIMTQLNHPCLIGLVGLVYDIRAGNDSPPMLVMEFASNGSLYALLRSASAISWNEKLRIAGELSRGLAYLHKKKVVHRDIKSLNVVLGDHMNAKWCDFGLSCLKQHSVESHTATAKEDSSTSYAGTSRWMSPELLARLSVRCFESDMWALGMVFYEVASHKIPFSDEPNEAVVRGWIRDGEGEKVPEDCPAVLGEIMTKCWIKDRHLRPTAEMVALELEGTWTPAAFSQGVSANHGVSSGSGVMDESVIGTQFAFSSR